MLFICLPKISRVLPGVFSAGILINESLKGFM